ncbi:MAG: hypothetical protein AVDCRST_MAG93-4526 [uncultured Chloroflexia bacterium]|uniref:Uncharacterized protein n=1 Tax=uncultured Chloroflexia bacterium TaxID=1672391 RepID=A0A6J4K9V2_9CHLR|nr:MAG: hypothetical protein AVDCRST_MAG93-4526 [uncultured Chloroflexia bacterium]
MLRLRALDEDGQVIDDYVSLTRDTAQHRELEVEAAIGKAPTAPEH